ncbi:hypothetical protein DFJ74DRAFT_502839 [Hyaloraphidium curvatum]|nr:hypothetical protein DFJ74DRAFT_502839 [Hyaloraphidium curvatum]
MTSHCGGSLRCSGLRSGAARRGATRPRRAPFHTSGPRCRVRRGPCTRAEGAEGAVRDCRGGGVPRAWASAGNLRRQRAGQPASPEQAGGRRLGPRMGAALRWSHAVVQGRGERCAFGRAGRRRPPRSPATPVDAASLARRRIHRRSFSAHWTRNRCACPCRRCPGGPSAPGRSHRLQTCSRTQVVPASCALDAGIAGLAGAHAPEVAAKVARDVGSEQVVQGDSGLLPPPSVEASARATSLVAHIAPESVAGSWVRVGSSIGVSEGARRTELVCLSPHGAKQTVDKLHVQWLSMCYLQSSLSPVLHRRRHEAGVRAPTPLPCVRVLFGFQETRPQ